MTLTIIVPTRERPQAIHELIEACTDTMTSLDSELFIAVDGYDQNHETMDAYMDIESDAPPWVTFGYGPRRRLCPTLNHWATELVRSDQTVDIGFMGDDHRPRTVGWDTLIMQTLASRKHVIAYGDDGFQGANLPTAVFMDGRIVHRLGYMVPPTLLHLFCDNYWKALGEGLGTLRYLPDVKIEHMHPHAGKAPNDPSYAASHALWAHDEDAWKKWEATDLRLDIHTVKFGEPT